MTEYDPDSWTPAPSVEMPSPLVRFHKVMQDGEVIDTLAVLEDGRSVSLTVLFGEPEGAAQ